MPARPDQIRALRASAGITQAAAAELLGYQILAIKRWESGEREPDACQWALYRARVAMLLGDEAAALDVLRETLTPA